MTQQDRIPADGRHASTPQQPETPTLDIVQAEAAIGGALAALEAFADQLSFYLEGSSDPAAALRTVGLGNLRAKATADLLAHWTEVQSVARSQATAALSRLAA